ncbi:MAG: helix-turn-helix transcriptional regulator [Mycobacterium kyogaense]
MDRDALAGFLRRRREAITPAEVGLPDGVRRRTAGLRREEVAQLAGMSADYYGRLEQGRSTQPSTQMIRAMARALRLSDDETDHLHHLAGHAAPDRGSRSMHVGPALMFVLDQLRDAAAFVTSDTYVVLAQNDLATVLMGDLVDAHALTGLSASMSYRWFTEPQMRERVPPHERHEHSRIMVADLRAVWARRRTDPDVRELVDALRKQSSEFAELWELHEVAVRRMQRKTFLTTVGPLTLDCEVLAATHGQKLVVLTPPPGSAALQNLRLLSVVGPAPSQLA